MKKFFFASDNTAAAHPEILNAINSANRVSNSLSYGGDEFTAELNSNVKKIFGNTVECATCFNGTGANVSVLSHFLRPWETLLCTSDSHLATDECGALERIAGAKLTLINCINEKISTQNLDQFLTRQKDPHSNRIRALSISQSTEWGRVYSLAEIKEISNFCKKNNLLFHLDGARLANAVASLNCSLIEATFNSGVDLVSFGGTKNGLLFGELVLFANSSLAKDFSYSRKQCLQLSSKSRFLAAQFIEYFRNDLWRKNAENANRSAQMLAKILLQIPGAKLSAPVEANGVFIRLPKNLVSRLEQIAHFYPWGNEEGIYRFMTSWSTDDNTLELFSNELRTIL